MTNKAIRLYHPQSGQHFIVKDGQVYADLDGDNHIAKSEKMAGARAGVSSATLLEAARYFSDLYDVPYHGAPNRDGTIKSGGQLNSTEVKQFESDPKGVAIARTALERHLDFFDGKTPDGKITVGENWNGWRQLGYGFFRSVFGTAASAILFGRLKEGFTVDIARIKEKRPAKNSGLYDKNGEVDQALMGEYLAEFKKHAKGGFISQEKALEIIKSKANPGTVSKGQFRSLFELCTRLNRGKETISEEQFKGLFDNSLLHLAASIPNEHGRRRY